MDLNDEEVRMRMVESFDSRKVECGIRAVWAATLEEEVAKIQDLVEEYHFVAVEVRSPGILVRPTHPSDSYLYKILKCNVDMLKVTQIELTFSDAGGNLPKDIATWQFNFSFNLHKDMYSCDTIAELRNCGVAVDRLHEEGIDAAIFGEVLTSSGLVLNEQIQWVSVTGCTQSFSSKWGERGSVQSIPDAVNDDYEESDECDFDTVNKNGYLAYANPLLAYAGIYDFAVLLTLLTGKPLPETVEGFCEAMQLYYPKVCLRRPRLSQEELAKNCADDHRQNADRRIHCLRNVTDPSTFAYHALEEWFLAPDKLGWGMIAPGYAHTKVHSLTQDIKQLETSA